MKSSGPNMVQMWIFVDLNISEFFKDPHLSRWKNIVEVLKEGLILDIIIGKDKGDAFAFSPSCPIQHFQVIQEIGHVVCSNKKTNTINSAN